MFEIRNISKKYGDEFVLRDISMTIGSGLNFIIGSSGSGKTTLLKIISGMELSFDGEVFYCGQSIKKLKEQQKSYFYNNIFGFIWQDFNLLDELTVLENVMLPQYLKQVPDKKAAMKVLKELKITELANQKAGRLSGGQKQRVAIARELIKNPQVIIADEPTSALDETSAKTTMDILRNISRTRTVIVVTHDTSLIDQKSKVYELDKGELIAAAADTPPKMCKFNTQQKHKLSFSHALKLSANNIKHKRSRFAATSASLLIAASLLLITLSGAISDSNQSSFDHLFSTYGNSILDISIVNSFTSAGGTDGQQNDAPNAAVDQDISGLYNRFLDDERITHIVFSQAFTDIETTVDDNTQKIEATGNTPSINELIAGTMPMGNGSEVVVPQGFVKKLGFTDEEMLGKTMDFTGAIYNWDSGEPIPIPVSTTAKIVGVVDTTVKYESNGQIAEFSVDDSFFFSQSALYEMRAQAQVENSNVNFVIRAKTPSDLIAIKDELNSEGIVPLGQFELVEDLVRLNQQTSQQSGSATIVIALLSAVIVLAVSMITALMRRREYAIYKVSGYSTLHLSLLTISEYLLASFVSVVLFLCVSPLTNMASTAIWNVNILSGRLLSSGVLLVLAMSVISCIITILASAATKASVSLRTGDR